jgi:hypothetical protein
MPIYYYKLRWEEKLTNAIFLMPAIIIMGMIVCPATAYVEQVRIHDQGNGRNKQ